MARVDQAVSDKANPKFDPNDNKGDNVEDISADYRRIKELLEKEDKFSRRDNDRIETLDKFSDRKLI